MRRKVLPLLIIIFLVFPAAVSAQSASPSGSLIEKLDALKKEIASKAAEIKTEINKKVQDKAIFGSILRVEEGEIVIETANGNKTLKYDEFTEVLGLNNKKIKIETLEEDDNIAALGDVDDKNNLVAKRLVFLQNYATTSGELVWGRIEKTNGSSITLKNKSGQTETVSTNGQTVFYLGNNEASIADAKPEKFMTAKGTRLKDGSLRTRFVYFIPSVGFIKPDKNKGSSNSASVKN
jgi:predicted nucleotidyltransferase